MNANMEIRSVTGSIAEAARENPLGVALLGMGLVWLVGSRTHAPQRAGQALNYAAASLGSAASSVGDMAHRATSAASGLGETARQTAEQASAAIQQTAMQTADRAADATRDVADRASTFTRDIAKDWKGVLPSAGAMTDQLRMARARISDAFDQQPLVLAAGAFAVGAAIAATLPAIRIKSDNFGKVAETAAGTAATGLANAVDRVDDAVRAAQGEAQAQASRIAEKAGELGARGKDAASDAAAAVRSQGASPNSLL
ncbi:MAG: hypothetical protein U1E19_08605 [Rhodoblastus sp.]